MPNILHWGLYKGVNFRNFTALMSYFENLIRSIVLMVFVHSCKGGIVYFVLLYLFQSKHVPSLVVPNVSAVLTDFQTIGEGLVKKIEVVNA